MKETLTCSQCSKNWKREVSRGRKPTVCPKCIKQAEKESKPATKSEPKPKQIKTTSEQVSTSSTKKRIVEPSLQKEPDLTIQQDSSFNLSYSKVYSSFYPRHPDAESLLQSTKNGSVWQCPNCKIFVRPSLAISQPPTHKCTPNSMTVREFIRIE